MLAPACMQYTDGAPVLRNVTFSVPGGSTVALVGATGSGKSTILRLLFRWAGLGCGARPLAGGWCGPMPAAQVGWASAAACWFVVRRVRSTWSTGRATV